MRNSRHGGRALFALLAVAALVPAPARAGVTNPDLSVIGQPSIRLTDDPADPARKRPVFALNEVEFMADAYLNPYAKGAFVLSFGENEVSVEEGYFTLLRGLPGDLAIKGGKYRADFGKMNPAHPHTYPFEKRMRVLGEYLPGEEAFNETGLQVNRQFGLPGDVALTAAADVLQGDSFRLPREPASANDPLMSAADAASGDRADEPRAALLGRLSAFVPAGERSGVELGLSATQGTNNVGASARTNVLGADVKAKLWRSANSYLLMQGEYLAMDREEAGWDSTAAAYTTARVRPSGGYLFADWNFSPRWDAGLGWERYRSADQAGAWNQGFRAFGGLALMEETTSFRIDWERFTPGAPAGAPAPGVVNTITLRVLFSMGPHKAHQF
jgi:hypothetical protein